MQDSAEDNSEESIADSTQKWWQNRRFRVEFALHLWRQLGAHNAFQAAASLCYTTLLALVPLLTVVLGVVSALPVADNMSNQLQDFVFANFVPAAGETVRDYLSEFVGNTSTLTGAGGFFLIVTSLMLMNTIEQTLNRIWEVSVPRSLVNRLLMYWTVLTLGPVLFGGSLALTSYLATQAFGSLADFLLRFTPFIVAWIGYALLYMVAPNRRVRPRYAFGGGLLAAILFETAKAGFIWYVSAFPTYKVLYGALATFPIFLLWIYVSWIITLLGATFTAAMTTFHFRESEWEWPRRLEFALVLRLLSHLWHAQKNPGADSRGLGSEQLLSLESAMSDEQLQRLMGQLHSAGLVTRNEAGDNMLAVDLNEVSLGDLYRSGPYVLPINEKDKIPAGVTSDRKLQALLDDFTGETKANLSASVKSYIQ